MGQVKESSYVPVKSAIRTMDVFELLAEFSDGLSLKSIGKQLNIPLSSIYNLVMTLTDRGYLLRDERSRIYRLGPQFAQLQMSYLANTNLIQLALPVMEDLHKKTGETSSLAVLQRTRVLYIHKVLGEGSLQLIGPTGTSRYAHANAAGKVLLAQLTDTEIENIFVEEYLPKLTPQTISNRTQLKKVLQEIRKKNFAVENQEAINGVWAVAGCIWDRDGLPVAALSIVAPISHLDNKRTSEWHQLVIEGAFEISKRLGFRKLT